MYLMQKKMKLWKSYFKVHCTQTYLKRELELPYICVGQSQVMDIHQPEDRAKDFQDVNLDSRQILLQRSMGPVWNSKSDTFNTKYKQSQLCNGTEFIKQHHEVDK